MQEKEHPSFKRVNIDLIHERKISLSEALCGCTLRVKHLDGRVIKARARPPPAVPLVAALAAALA
jgi:DnaJ family protein A protein 2